MANTARQLASGSALRVISLLLGIIISFFMMPFVIKGIGDRWYGLWVLTSSILGFYGVLDIGLSSATQRFIAYHIDDDDKTQLLNVFNNSLFLFSVIGAIALVITIGIMVVAPIFWNASNYDISTFRIVIVIMGATLAFSFPFYVLNGILTANYRYDISSYIQMFKLCIRTALIVFVIMKNYGIIGMALATIVVDLVSHIITLTTCKKLAPWIKINFALVSIVEIKKLFSYSIYSFIIFISYKLKNSLDTFIISAIVGLSLVTPYNIALQLTNYLNSVISSVIGVTMPLFTRKFSQQKHEAIKNAFSTITRIAATLSISVSVPTIIFGPNFIKVWMGPHYTNSILPLQVLAFAIMLATFQAASLQVFYSHSKHNILAAINIFEAIVNLSLSVFLVKKYGIIGAALGTGIPLIFNRYLVYPYYAAKIIGISLSRYYYLIMKPTIISIALLIIIFKIKLLIPPLVSYISIFTAAGIACATCAIILAIVILKREDRAVIYSAIAKAKSF